jgi:CRISPR-associated exonuclease Cas4
MIDEIYIGGTQVNYYFVCKTKLWLFSHHIGMEKESDAVKLGKLLHKETFRRDNKDIQIGPIAIDVVRKGDFVEIREVKKSDTFEEAHRFQTLYYIYYLQKLGIRAKAVISFPKQRKTISLELDEGSERRLEEVLQNISKIVNGQMPEPRYRRVCRKCAYFEFCFA